MWNFIKGLFGGNTETPKGAPRARPAAPSRYTKHNVRRTNYYLKDGNYYSNEDDSLVEDLILLALLTDMFSMDAVDYNEFIDEGAGGAHAIETAADVAAIDIATESVREEYSRPEPVYSAPEPSYSSSDSGSSDCGGCDD